MKTKELLKLHHLKYFCKAYELNSITRAADELFISQPSVTLAIQYLENRFQVRLFNREKQTITPTNEGTIFYESSKKILLSLDSVQNMMMEMGDNRNRISIGVPPMIGACIFPKLYEYFKLSHPEIKCITVEKPTSGLIKDLNEGIIDICIAITNNISKEFFHIQNLLETQTVFCTYSDHRLSNNSEINIKRINNEDIIMYKDGYYQNKIITAKLKSNNTNINIIHRTSELYTMVEFINNKLCSGFLFKEMGDLNENLVCIPFDDPIKINIGLVTSNKNFIYKDTNRFITSSLEYFGKKQ